MIPVEGLGTFQKKEMKDYMAKRALGVLEEMLAPEDAAGMMRLVLLDAGWRSSFHLTA